MDIKIIPSKLNGTVNIPSSKSLTHRALICAALADGKSVIKNISPSMDITATLNALTCIGAKYEKILDGIIISGINKSNINKADIDCFESGSTLRFLIPITAAFGINAEYIGHGRLPERPITPYIRELSKNGITFSYNNTMPFQMHGTLKSGTFNVEGNISSQFITGLLFALPLLDGNSKIVMTSPLESKPYANMTIECLKNFGINIEETDYGYFVKGNQKYQPKDLTIEGDYSQAAFFYVANVLGSNVKINNLNCNSSQGDKKIVEIISSLCYNNMNEPNGFNVDAIDIPDLVPVLGVLGTFCQDKSTISGAERLKIKESDRLAATSNAINAINGRIFTTDDGMIINHAILKGGVIDSAGDHRIAMSAAIAATICSEPVIIKGAECVEKSYPDFFKDYINLGGTANVITLE